MWYLWLILNMLYVNMYWLLCKSIINSMPPYQWHDTVLSHTTPDSMKLVWTYLAIKTWWTSFTVSNVIELVYYIVGYPWPIQQTYFTDREKSPGVLSLSRIKNAPSMGCFISNSSALLRVIRPWYHLHDKQQQIKLCI